MRRASPWRNIASASMKLPMNRKTIGSAKAENAVRIGATPRSTTSSGPRSAVTARGNTSVTQKTTISERIAPSVCASDDSVVGQSQQIRNTAGPRTNPARARVIGVSYSRELDGAANQLGPAGQPDGVIGPLDVLRATGCNDVDAAACATGKRCGHGRGAGTGARGFCRADAPFPDQDANAVGRLDVDELDVG